MDWYKSMREYEARGYDRQYACELASRPVILRKKQTCKTCEGKGMLFDRSLWLRGLSSPTCNTCQGKGLTPS